MKKALLEQIEANLAIFRAPRGDVCVMCGKSPPEIGSRCAYCEIQARAQAASLTSHDYRDCHEKE